MLTEKDLEKRYSEILSMVFTKGYTLDMNKSVPYRMFFYKGHNALSVSLVEVFVTCSSLRSKNPTKQVQCCNNINMKVVKK